MNNLQEIQCIIEYIESHLFDDKLNLETLSKNNGYSQYHLHRMFSSIVKIPLHAYIQRRRLTEAARMLVNSDRAIFDIALDSGYETQQSFTRAFKAMYKYSPHFYRNHKEFIPMQLPYVYSKNKQLSENMILDIKIVNHDQLFVMGYDGNTKYGFRVIGKCWHLLHKNKTKIKNRSDLLYLIGINDYTNFEYCNDQMGFHYIAGAQVCSFDCILKNMKTFTFAPSRYVIFYLRGRNEESMKDIIEYIYHDWLPQSQYRFNENNCYDFIKYGEDIDELGQSEIQIWIPIL